MDLPSLGGPLWKRDLRIARWCKKARLPSGSLLGHFLDLPTVYTIYIIHISYIRTDKRTVYAIALLLEYQC